jgi:hypothetical protein
MSNDRTDRIRQPVGQHEASANNHRPVAVLPAEQIPDRAQIDNRAPSICQRAVFCAAKVLVNACRIQAC